METPETRYAWNGDVALAYQVLGEGPADLVYIPEYASNLEWNWEHPLYARFLRSLASFSRLVILDVRGTGCSDGERIGMPLETFAEDVLVVLDEIGLARACVLGSGDNGFVAAMAAAAFPERVSSLILFDAAPTYRPDEDVPWGWSVERWAVEIKAMRRWGSRVHAANRVRDAMPSLATDEYTIGWMTRLERLCMAPSMAIRVSAKYPELDIRSVLPSIRVPALILQRTGDAFEPSQSGAYLAEHIPDARLIELPGADRAPWVGQTEPVLLAIEEFLGVERPPMQGIAYSPRFCSPISWTPRRRPRRSVTLSGRSYSRLMTKHRR